jgi:uncharacterized protein (DUF433 family)
LTRRGHHPIFRARAGYLRKQVIGPFSFRLPHPNLSLHVNPAPATESAVFIPALSTDLLSAGIYTIPEAARLTRVTASRIRRWMKGYDFKTARRERHHSNPVWAGQLPRIDNQVAVGFRDLMEIRFVDAFIRAGVSRQTMREAHRAAKTKLGTDHPFCTHKFETDGREILLEQAQTAGDSCLIDITNDQREFKRIVTPFLKELDFVDQSVSRWWPLGKKHLVVVDPARNLGQPIVTRSGVPTRVLANSVRANADSVESVARWFEVAPEEVRDAVAFEARLLAA